MGRKDQRGPVEPPFDLLASMVTVRVHLDDVPETNAPLLVAPCSHKRGRIPTAEIPEVVRQCGIVCCLAAAGDIWLYATPIPDASEAASQPLHRRFCWLTTPSASFPAGWNGWVFEPCDYCNASE